MADIFTLKQHFYAGNYENVLEAAGDASPLAQAYCIRSALALGQSPVIKFANHTTTQIFQAYAAKDYAEVIGLAGLVSADHDIVFPLIGAAYAATGNAAEGAQVLLSQINHAPEPLLETALVLCELYLLLGDSKSASVFLVDYETKHNLDDIITNLTDATLRLVQNGEEKLHSARYFFEELAQTYESYKSLLLLMVVHLQLKNFDECHTIADKLDAIESPSDLRADFLANKITLFAAQGKDTSDIRNELLQLAPEHPSNVEYNALNNVFDGIVGRYSA